MSHDYSEKESSCFLVCTFEQGAAKGAMSIPQAKGLFSMCLFRMCPCGDLRGRMGACEHTQDTLSEVRTYPWVDASVFQRNLLGGHRSVGFSTRPKWHNAQEAGEMAQSIKGLPCKQEDMSLIPRVNGCLFVCLFLRIIYLLYVSTL